MPASSMALTHHSMVASPLGASLPVMRCLTSKPPATSSTSPSDLGLLVMVFVEAPSVMRKMTEMLSPSSSRPESPSVTCALTSGRSSRPEALWAGAKPEKTGLVVSTVMVPVESSPTRVTTSRGLTGRVGTLALKSGITSLPSASCGITVMISSTNSPEVGVVSVSTAVTGSWWACDRTVTTEPVSFLSSAQYTK